MKARLTKTFIDAIKPASRYFEVQDTEQPGLVLRVQPSGVLTYYARYAMPDGGRGRVRIAPVTALTPAEARLEAARAIALAVQGNDPQDLKRRAREARNNTLDNFLGVYQDRVHNRTTSDTVRRMRSVFPELVNKPLREIRPMWVENWRGARLREGRAPTGVNRNVACLKAILQKAVEWGVLSDNPLAKVRPLKTDNAPRPRYLSQSEETALYAAINAREERRRQERDNFNKWREDRGLFPLPSLRDVPFTDHLAPMILISLHTGIRRGELFALRWEDVQLDGNPLITILGKTSKSGRTRHVPLSAMARETLSTWKAQGYGAGLVFPNDGAVFTTVKKGWGALLKSAGISSFRWHDMRHDFASKLVMAGVDLNTVRELLGHANLEMTLRYAHLAPERLASAVAVLDRPPIDNIVPLETRQQAHS